MRKIGNVLIFIWKILKNIVLVPFYIVVFWCISIVVAISHSYQLTWKGHSTLKRFKI